MAKMNLRDLKVNEYGVFRDEARIAARQDEIYDLFDLPYFEPELREAGGEFEAAQEGDLPELVTLDDLRGDLQTHTQASDGHNLPTQQVGGEPREEQQIRHSGKTRAELSWPTRPGR